MTSFLKSYNIIWCFYFWRVLLLIANPPLYDYSTLSPHISLSPYSFQRNWHDHKKFSRFYQILSPTPPLTPPPPHRPDWGGTLPWGLKEGFYLKKRCHELELCWYQESLNKKEIQLNLYYIFSISIFNELYLFV